MNALYLGSCDFNKIPLDRHHYLKPFHRDGLLVNTVSFRDDDRSKWRSFRQMDGNQVSFIQEFLFKAGFMPRGVIDGVYDYVTQSAVRLFQEYLRTNEDQVDLIPDGIVGSGTMEHILRWENQGLKSEYHKVSTIHPSTEYEHWFNILNTAKSYYQESPGPILTAIESLDKTYSTRKPTNWTFDKNDLHLIGIRRNHTQSVHKRENDDLFVALINGMVFKFWGSTDPSVSMAKRSDEPFLIEGQHVYRFGWHKIFNERKIYRALKPFDPNGVLVLRDWDDDNSYTEMDLKVKDEDGTLKGLEVNNSINIHWSGIGTTNFSAGCQVIASKSYIDYNDRLQDCSQFASVSYGQLNDDKKKTKGAYNVLADLIVCFAKSGDNKVYYTLGREESLDLDQNFGKHYAQRHIDKLKSV